MPTSAAITRVYPKRKRAEVTYYDSVSDEDDSDTDYGESEVEEAPPNKVSLPIHLEHTLVAHSNDKNSLEI